MSERITVGGELARLANRDPFEPFVIVMSSGERYRVEDPNEIIFGRGAIVIVPLSGGGHSTLRESELSSIEVIAPTAKSA
jgi:hypothetical protein